MSKNQADTKGKNPIVKIGIYSICVNLFLVGSKFTLSIITSSLALRADAIHSFVDVIASIVLIIGLKISHRKSKAFPYGLYKVENVVSIIISLLLFLAAYEIVNEAVIGEHAAISSDAWVLACIAGLVLIPLFFGYWELKQGRRYNSPSLIADGTQFRADILGSSIVFFDLLGQNFGVPLDGIAAIIVAVFIIYAAWGLLKNGMRVLLDASVNKEILEKISKIIQDEASVQLLKSLTGRNSGRFIFIEATIAVRVNSLEKAHQLSERIELNVRKNVPNIDRLLIHCEPEIKAYLRYAIPLEDREGPVSEHFGQAQYFTIVDIDSKEKKIVRQEIVANPYRSEEKARGIKVAKFLLAFKPDVVVARESLAEKGPGYAFSDAGIKTMQVETISPSDLLNQLSSGTLSTVQ